MKNIFKTIIFALCVLSIVACEDDVDPIVAANGFTLSTKDAITPLVLKATEDANTAIELQWEPSKNGDVPTVSAYTIEVAAAGTNFAEPIVANNGERVVSGLTYDFTVQEMNAIAVQFPTYACGEAMKVDIRVKSVLGSGLYNSLTQYSSTITLDLTPYSPELPTLFFGMAAPATNTPGNLAASAVLNKDYEGYMYLQPGMYKFYKSGDCQTFEAPVVYGDNNNGSFNTLDVDGAAYQVINAGFYLVKADLTTSLYSVRAITWNIFGTAKPNFPNANTALTYNATTKLWETDFVLSNGYDFQFRSNGVGENALVLGGFDAEKTGLEFAGPIMSYKGKMLVVPGAKSSPRVNTRYHIALDLNSPRNYNFSIVANPLP